MSSLVRATTCARADRAAVRHAFAFKDDELLFARALLEVHSRLWLYRTNQRAFAGDFVIIDVSSPVVAQRPAYAVDLKRGEPVRIHAGTGIQLRNAALVVTQIAAAGVVDAARRPIILTGSAGAILRFLSARGLRAGSAAVAGYA